MKTFRGWWVRMVNALPVPQRKYRRALREAIVARQEYKKAVQEIGAARVEQQRAEDDRDVAREKLQHIRAEIFAELNARPARVPEELSEEEMRMAFAVTREETWFVAVRQVIRQHFADNVQIVSDPALVNSPGGLAGAGQSIGTLRTLLEDLERRRRAASEIDGDEDEDEE